MARITSDTREIDAELTECQKRLDQIGELFDRCMVEYATVSNRADVLLDRRLQIQAAD